MYSVRAKLQLDAELADEQDAAWIVTQMRGHRRRRRRGMGGGRGRGREEQRENCGRNKDEVEGEEAQKVFEGSSWKVEA